MTQMTSMDIHQIIEHLPHRYPFLLIDRVLHIEPGKSLTAIKNVSCNEPYFVGHFPQRMVMPGVLILEALAQATGILTSVTTQSKPHKSSLYYLAGIDNARFKRVVEPGDQLHLAVDVIRLRRDIYKYKGIATVDNQLVCSADIITAKRTIESHD